MAHVIIVTASVREFGFGQWTHILDSDFGQWTSGFGLGTSDSGLSITHTQLSLITCAPEPAHDLHRSQNDSQVGSVL